MLVLSRRCLRLPSTKEETASTHEHLRRPISDNLASIGGFDFSLEGKAGNDGIRFAASGFRMLLISLLSGAIGLWRALWLSFCIS